MFEHIQEKIFPPLFPDHYGNLSPWEKNEILGGALLLIRLPFMRYKSNMEVQSIRTGKMRAPLVSQFFVWLFYQYVWHKLFFAMYGNIGEWVAVLWGCLALIVANNLKWSGWSREIDSTLFVSMLQWTQRFANVLFLIVSIYYVVF